MSTTIVDKMPEGMKGVRKAIEAAGSTRALARLLGIDPAAISRWHQVPVRHLIPIEHLLGIPREELRPELYRRD